MQGSPVGTDNRGKILQAFSRALRREAHVLTQHPDLLWQQMYNRLQWEEEIVNQVLTREFAFRSAVGSVPWIRMNTSLLESDALIRKMGGHKHEVWSCAFSPCGRRIVSSGLWDNKLYIWDVETGQLLLAWEGNPESFYTCAFSPDGKLIASGGTDCKIYIWDATTSQHLMTLEGHTGGVGYCAFSHDGCMIASASEDHSVRVWDISNGMTLLMLQGHDKDVLACAFSPDDNLIVTASADKTLRIWNANNGMLLHILEGHTYRVVDCIFSPDGSRIASASEDNTLKLWDSLTGQLLLTLEGHVGHVNACAFSPDGEWIISVGDDKTLRLWDSTDGRLLSIFEAHRAGIYTCAFSRDGHTVVSGGGDRTLYLWDLFSIDSVNALKVPPKKGRSGAYSPDGQYLTYIDGSNLNICDVRRDQPDKILAGHSGQVNNFTFSADGQTIVSASQDKTLRIWEVSTGKLVRILEGHTGSVTACAISPDGNMIISAGADMCLRVWQADSGTLLRTQELRQLNPRLEEYVWHCAFSPYGKTIVFILHESLQFWNGGSYFEEKVDSKKIAYGPRVMNFSFSPDSHIIATGCDDKCVYLLQYPSETVLSKLESHTGTVNACAFSPDGSWLFTSSDDTLRMWNPVNGKLINTLRLPEYLQLGLHPAEPRLVCSSYNVIYEIELIGIQYQPIIVTAIEKQQCFYVVCPKCQQHIPIGENQLANELTCPTPGCDLHLRINPFVIHMA